MINSVRVQLGPWLPDQGRSNHDGLIKATNVLPAARGYKPVAGLASFTNALTAQCLGAISTRDSSNNDVVFAGSLNDLERINTDGTVNDVSRTAGYSTATDGFWALEAFGDFVMACNNSDPMQYFDLATSSVFADVSASSGLAPICKTMAVVRGFLVTGNTYDATDGRVPERIWWSGVNNPINWPTPGTATSANVQSDYQDLSGEGHVQRIIGGEYGLIFLDRSIYKMTYVGGDVIFQFDHIHQARGTICPNSVVKLGEQIFFCTSDGFFVFTGSQVQPIGVQRVDRTFVEDLDETYLQAVWGAPDPVNKTVVWTYPGAGNSSGVPNKKIVYHWPTSRWSSSNEGAELVFLSVNPGLTTADLSGAASQSTLDTQLWAASAPVLHAFNAAHELCIFGGYNLAAVIETAEHQLSPSRRSLVTCLRPDVEGSAVDSANVSIRVGHRNRLIDSATYEAAVTLNTTGNVPVRVDDRYHSFELNVSSSASWAYATAIEVEFATTGKR